MTLDRRTFLSLSGGVAVAGLVGGLALPPSAQALSRQAGADDASKRTLIVVDLQGGNDALNTLVPAVGTYHDARPQIGLSDDELLTWQGLDFGVHPALASLESTWNAGQLTALYGTGLVGQGRSHFVAQDAWRTARPGVPARSGWLGRWLEATPTAEPVPLRAVALGQSTLAAQGEEGRPVAVQSVDGFQLNPPRNGDAVTAAVLSMSSPQQDDLFGLVQASMPRTVDAVDELQSLIAQVSPGQEDNEADEHAALFGAAQAIIQGDVGTQVLYITINGFDTHSLQAAKQHELLRRVADGLDGLFTQLDLSGHGDQTLTLVVSEFGRRVAENGSAGTDHGQGGLSFLMGSAVAESTVIGEPDLDDLVNGDLRITLDARSMYQDALNWLGASDALTSEVLGGEWDYLNLLKTS